MKIHTRLTLWYAGTLSAGLLVMAAFVYFDLVPLDLTWAKPPTQEIRETAPGPEAAQPPEQSQEQGEQQVEEQTGEGSGSEVSLVLWCVLPPMAFALVSGWYLTRKTLNPIQSITRSAKEICARSLQARLARSGNGDELDELAGVFNSMLERLEESFRHVSDFTLNSAHELKTPLTIMHHQLEYAMARETLGADATEWLAAQLDEVQRLMKIVEGLNFLAQADSQRISLHSEALDFAHLVREGYDEARILGEALQLRVELADCEEAPVRGDRHRLRQAVLNLVDNAVKYNEPRGWVRLQLRRKDKSVELAVSNAGPGIEPALQRRVLERFFRGAAAHDRTVEGCGLGLSITQCIVAAHGGALHITSRPAPFTTVLLQLPVGS